MFDCSKEADLFNHYYTGCAGLGMPLSDNAFMKMIYLSSTFYKILHMINIMKIFNTGNEEFHYECCESLICHVKNRQQLLP